MLYYTFGIVLYYIFDIDNYYLLVLLYFSRSTTPSASPLRLPFFIANEFGTGQQTTCRG